MLKRFTITVVQKFAVGENIHPAPLKACVQHKVVDVIEKERLSTRKGDTPYRRL